MNELFLCKFCINKCFARICNLRGIKFANISENKVIANNSAFTEVRVTDHAGNDLKCVKGLLNRNQSNAVSYHSCVVKLFFYCSGIIFHISP